MRSLKVEPPFIPLPAIIDNSVLQSLLDLEKYIHKSTTLLEATSQTRRYPWGIQRLVSTHQFPHNPRSVQICIFLGVGGPDQLNPKCQDLSKSAFGVGRGWSRPTFLKYLSGAFKDKICHTMPYSGCPCSTCVETNCLIQLILFSLSAKLYQSHLVKLMMYWLYEYIFVIYLLSFGSKNII